LRFSQVDALVYVLVFFESATAILDSIVSAAEFGTERNTSLNNKPNEASTQ